MEASHLLVASKAMNALAKKLYGGNNGTASMAGSRPTVGVVHRRHSGVTGDPENGLAATTDPVMPSSHPLLAGTGYGAWKGHRLRRHLGVDD